MTQRIWFDLAAALRLSEHVLSQTAIDPHQPSGPTAPSLLLIGGRWPRLAGNRLPALDAGNTVTAIHVDGPGSIVRTEFWLPLDSTADGATLRDLLRAGHRRGHYWFTIAADGAKPATVAARHTATRPANALWMRATITDPRLGTYRGQIARGYHHNGFGFARIHHRDLPNLLEGALTGMIGFDCVQRRLDLFFLGWRRGMSIVADTDGFYHLDDPAFRWTAGPDPVEPDDEPFAYDPPGLRCLLCGAISDNGYSTPSPADGDIDGDARCGIRPYA